MATLGQVVTSLGEHEQRLISLDGKLNFLEANHEGRLAALETSILQRIADILGTEKEKDKGLRYKEAKECIPQPFDGSRKTFLNYAHQVKVWSRALMPTGGEKLLETATKLETEFEDDEDIDDITYPHAKDFNEKLYQMMSTTTSGDAIKYVMAAGVGHGLRAWQSVSKWYDARDAGDKEAKYSVIMNQDRAQSEEDLHNRFVTFEKKVKEYEERFGAVQEEGKIVALKKMVPMEMLNQRFRGKKFTTYKSLRDELVAFISDKPASSTAPMEIGAVEEENEKNDKEENKDDHEIYAFAKGGKGGKGGYGVSQCFECGQKGHFARECPKKGQGKGGKGGDGAGKGYNHYGNYNNYQAPDNYNNKGNYKGDWQKGSYGAGHGGGKGYQGKGAPYARSENSYKGYGKGSWQGKGQGMYSFEGDAPPGLHDDDDGDGEESWAMWSLQEAQPEITIEKKMKKMKINEKVANKNRFSVLNMMEEEEEESPMMMNENDNGSEGEWVKIQATVDSGSAEHAMPSGSFEKISTIKGEKYGKKYVAANGGTILNEGEKVIKCVTDRGVPISITFQMAKVVKPLLSAKKLAKTGHQVILEDWRPRIVSPQGFTTPIRTVGGVYVVDLWIKKKFGDLNREGFSRQ